MDLSHLNRAERNRITLENLSKAKFYPIELNLEENSLKFYAEFKKRFSGVQVIKLKIEANQNMLWGSLGFQQFTNEFINNSNFKNAISQLNPFEEYYELKRDIKLGGSLFNFIGDLSHDLYKGGCYGSNSDINSDEILKITKAFIDDNLKDIYSDYQYIRIHEPWTKWFGHKPLISTTYLVINTYKDEMLMICIADTD
jgi:hypothetical protein